REREADPRNHHRPGFDTAVSVHAFFERRDLEDVFDIKCSRLVAESLDVNGPGARDKVSSLARDGAFVGRKLVEVVVVSDVFVRGLLFVRDLRDVWRLLNTFDLLP